MDQIDCRCGGDTQANSVFASPAVLTTRQPGAQAAGRARRPPQDATYSRMVLGARTPARALRSASDMGLQRAMYWERRVPGIPGRLTRCARQYLSVADLTGAAPGAQSAALRRSEFLGSPGSGRIQSARLRCTRFRRRYCLGNLSRAEQYRRIASAALTENRVTT